jgi:hypothetical protein
MNFIHCSRCGPHYAVDNYMENGVCGPCLLTQITEELGLYERGENEEEVDFARHESDGQGIHV